MNQKEFVAAFCKLTLAAQSAGVSFGAMTDILRSYAKAQGVEAVEAKSAQPAAKPPNPPELAPASMTRFRRRR